MLRMRLKFSWGDVVLNAKAVFERNISQANELGALYSHLSGLVTIPEQFDDLLRSQVVNAVSAFDKLMHDLIRIGVVHMFEGVRPHTGKYLSEVVSIQHLPSLAVGAIPPPSVRFEEIIREKLSYLSFQEPGKVSDGLSYIWSEKQKWQRISVAIGITDEEARRKMKLIATRRNAIVHEADLDPITSSKQAITRLEADNISSFLLSVGTKIVDLVV